MKLPLIVAVRGFAVPVDREKSIASDPRKYAKKQLRRPSEEVLVFDCETASDHTQCLRFGTYQCRKRGKLREQGIFYETRNPKALTAKDLSTIRSYAKRHALELRTLESFVKDVFYRYAYAYGALVVGFNLPFDISRLANGIATSHAHDMRNAFSFTLADGAFRPNVLVRHLNARASFIRFAAVGQPDGRSERKRGQKSEKRRGYFQDVKTLAAALMGKSHSLKSLADTLQTEHRKSASGGHGKALTDRYLDYAMNDTQVTWECYQRLARDYAAHGLKGTPPHRIYSEASLGKAYLNEMDIAPPQKMQPDVPSELTGRIMGTYYGGRSEVRIRRRIARVLYCDFRSMYPTVCTLMGLWSFVTAQGFDWKDWTDGARQLLDGVKLGDIQKKRFWDALTVLVQIQPDDDILPVRAAYDGKNRTIGLNYLSAQFPMWFTLADCIASKILTGRSPRIVQAVRFTARAVQEGLKPIRLGGDDRFVIDPAKGDFYRDIIVRRGEVQSRLKDATDVNEIALLSAQQQMLKLMANSTSYGIFAEQNVQSFDRPRQVDLFGQESVFRTTSKSIEEPGTHFHPLIATLITGAARLMLACAEQVAANRGIGWAFCDTDSLALARPYKMGDGEFLKRCAQVTAWFDRLDPYGDGKPLFKMEAENFALKNGKQTDKHKPLYALAISAKRYVLFNLDSKRRPVIRKGLAHGLGHLMAPYGAEDGPVSIPLPPGGIAGLEIERWQHDLWYQIVVSHLEDHPESVDLSKIPQLDRPARSRYGATTATLRNWFRKFNAGKPLYQQVVSFNFLLAFQVSQPAYYQALANGDFPDDMPSGPPAVVAPYSDSWKEAVANAFDRRTGNPVPASILKTYQEAVASYAFHAEPKFDNASEFDCGVTERKHVEALALEYIGKEAHRYEEQFYLGELPEAQIDYGMSDIGRSAAIRAVAEAANTFSQVSLAEEAGITRQQLAAIAAGAAKPEPRTLMALLKAIRSLAVNSEVG